MEINIKKKKKKKKFIVSFGKTIIMSEFIIETLTLKFYACYLLIGTVAGLFLETVIRATDQEVTNWERASLICGWPVHCGIFIYHFVKGIFGND